MSTGVREPVAAGSLYASDSQELRANIDSAINSADSEFTNPKVLVLPSCGLTEAPHVAGAGMIMLETERDHVKQVVVIGDHQPHLGGRQFKGIAVPRSIAFRTPLGDLLADRDGLSLLHGHPNVVANDRPFEKDTSIEVHLPPIQRLLGAVRIMPILVGDATTAEIVDVLERVWGQRDTLIIATSAFGAGDGVEAVSDLGEAARSAFVHTDTEGVAMSGASSPRTLAAIMAIVGRRSMGLLELASDTITDSTGESEFIEAATFAAWEATDMSLGPADVEHLRSLARSAVELTVLGGKVAGTDMGRVPPALGSRRASVVTLRRDGQTRGSAGTIEADRPLAGSVIRNASAACADPRLPSIQPAELNELSMTISVVSPIERVFPQTWEELQGMLVPGQHGLLVMSPTGRGAQLPAMWARFSSPTDFVGALAQKAGVSGPDQVTGAAWYRFETIDY